jgi:imidazolonepropionase-like amidohydrolase
MHSMLGIGRSPGACALIALALALTPTSRISAQAAVVLTNVTVVDPSGDSGGRPRSTIVIADGRIVRVDTSGRAAHPPGARVIDGTGKFVIPGLWDMHVHFMNAGRSALPVFLANGVTSVREMGGFLDSTRSWQSEMRAGTLAGPRLMTPGLILESPQYLARVRVRDSIMGGGLASRILPYRVGVRDSLDARRVIDSLTSLRVDFVKFRSVASASALRGILREARRVGLRVAGHEPEVLSVAAAVEAGLDDVEHTIYVAADSLRRRTVERMAANNAWHTPTLVVSRAVLLSGDSAQTLLWGPAAASIPERLYASEWLLSWWRMQVDERLQQPEARRTELRRRYRESLPLLRDMTAAGVRILAGSDAGSVLIYPGFSLHDELELLVSEGGLTPRQALWAATTGPATFFGRERELGRVAPGTVADLVLLNANPLLDISHTRRIHAVIQNGRYLDRAALDAMLRGVRDEVKPAR